MTTIKPVLSNDSKVIVLGDVISFKNRQSKTDLWNTEGQTMPLCDWKSGSQLVHFSHSVVSYYLWPHGLQHARLLCPSPTLRAYSNSCPLSQWFHPNISSSVTPFSSSSVFPSIRVFSSELTLHIRYPKYWSFSFSFSFLPMNIQSWFPLGLTVWSPCHARHCQESSPEQFKSISSSVLSLLYGPTVTSLHDCWENHSFDDMDVCWQSNVSAF